MRVLNIEDVRFPEAIIDTYLTCKYIERQGIPLDTVTLGNVHDCIEDAVDDNQLPVTQVIIENNYLLGNQPAQDTIQGYLIGV